jgi:leucyl aminopeptidase
MKGNFKNLSLVAIIGGTMKVACEQGNVLTAKVEGVAIFTFEEGSNIENLAKTKLGPNIQLARERKEFEGKTRQLWMEKHAGTPRFHLLVGLGKRANLTPDLVRAGAAMAADALRGAGAKSIAMALPEELEAEVLGQAITEGAILRTYQFLQYKTQKLDEIKSLESITIFTDRDLATSRKGVEVGKTIAESCNLARDLQNTPSIDLTPQLLAQQAAKLAKEEKLRCTILDKSKLVKQGYGGIASVGKGSAHEPRLVTLEYAPKGAKKTIAIVGKGITFDTGGISIKPGANMADMKFDMSGAASVLGIMRNASQLKLPVRIIGILCLAENMPDGNAYKPGDVVRTKAGKTIEIDNTDAEGRVVLADGLHHATTFKPDQIIDMATLTGAIVVTLGDVAAGVFGNQEMINKLNEASASSGEKIWQLPLWDEYAEDIKSSIADMKNMGMPGNAGSIAGAMLLKEFVGDTPWVHIDIAGVAWAKSRERYFTSNGGTAFGVRLLTEYLRRA